ncbi:MAG: hypothetical protein IJ191_09340 [Treponema sp.]|nr:hypothetical protein [Treponema sp.]
MKKQILFAAVTVVLFLAEPPLFSWGTHDEAASANSVSDATTDNAPNAAADAAQVAKGNTAPAAAPEKTQSTASTTEHARSALSERWEQFKNDAGTAAQSFGSALSETGRELSNQVNDALDTQFYGTWTHTSGTTTTTITCNRDGTMEISQTSGMITQYWRGTGSGAIALITFKISESGRSSPLRKTAVKDNKTWRLTYSISDDGATMTVRCTAIPTTDDGHNFSNATAFTKH